MTTAQPAPCPPDCEELNTQSQLAARCCLSRTQIGRLLVSGKLKAVSVTTHQGRPRIFYRTPDLDAITAESASAFASKARLFPMGVIERMVRENWPAPQRRTMIAEPTPQAFTQ